MCVRKVVIINDRHLFRFLCNDSIIMFDRITVLNLSRLIEQLSWQMILACKSSSTEFLLGVLIRLVR